MTTIVINCDLTRLLKSRFAHQSNNQVSIEDADAIIQEIEHDFDSEHLIKWTRALDFECYQAEWHVLATSGHSNGNCKILYRT